MMTKVSSEMWPLQCQCGKTILDCHAEPIQIAICHCNDCRSARGGDSATHTLVLLRRDQVDTKLDDLKAVSGDAYLDKVPRYFCNSCGDWLLGDCTPIGFDMALLPAARISAQVMKRNPDYHMHLEQSLIEPPDDGLPRFQGNPEDPYMATLIEGCS